MAWNSQGGGDGGGPWGGGNKGGGNNGGGRGPWNSGSGGGGGEPPNLEDVFRKGQERFRQMVPGGSGSGRVIALAIVVGLALWGATGFYTVDQDEVGVVLRFGKFVNKTEPGLNYHLPTPIEVVIKTSETRINRTEIGYRGAGARSSVREMLDESLMLTGDENIVDVNFSVFWKVDSPEKYLFSVRDPDVTVKMAAESAMREIIGQMPIKSALVENREKIAQTVLERMQEMLNDYQAGVKVTQVQLLETRVPPDVLDAFHDVQRAQADQERMANEAEAYRNSILPRARGEAQRVVQEAEAYKEKVTNIAEGDAQRFLSVYAAYQLSPEVVSRRLYIEAISDVLQGSQKVVIDPSANNVIPYMPLPGLKSAGGVSGKEGGR